MAIDDNNLSRSILEQLQMLAESLGSRNENTREAIAEAEVLTEAERFLRQKEIKEREQAAQALKDARQREADAIWNSLSATDKQIERQKELDAEANRLTQQQIQKDNAYIDEVKKINENQITTFERRAKYELESLGLVKDSQGKLHQLANEREAIEKKLIEDLQKGLDESPDLQKKYGADAKNAKLAMDQERLYKQQLTSMGRYIDSNGKLIDTTVKLTKEQENSLRKIKQETQSREESKKAVEEFNDMLGKKGAMAAGGFAVTTAFDFLKAGIVGTYKGLIAYEDALLDGVRGESVMAAMISEQQNAYADALDKAGGSLVSFGGQLIVQAAQMALTNIPMALLAVAIAGLLAVLGYASQAQAAIIKRDAELNKKRAALSDEIYKNFLELGEASVTGARGVTGLIDDLKSVGLTIKEFEKLNKILSSNTREIAMFGSTTMAGVKSFIEVTGGLINSEMSKTFEKMGISQNSQMEHAQKYMAMQARFGLLEGKSKQDLIKGTQNYINELDKTAALTGASRKEQETARDFAMAQAELRAAIFDEREKAKRGDQEAAIRVKELQGQMELVAKLKLIGQDQLGIGVARNAAAGQIVDPLSAKAVRMLGESIEAYKTGAGTEQSRVGALGEELKVGFKQLAPLARIKVDAINGLAEVDIAKLVDGMDAFTNVKKLRAEFEADPKNKGKTFDDKALDEMLSRVAKDSRTENSMEIFRQTQKEAIDKQTQLLNGQLGAANQMMEAAGIFGTAGNTMLEAAKKMWETAFGKDKDTTRFDKGTGILAAEAKAADSRKASENATESLALIEDRKKAATTELKAMRRRGATQEDLANQEKKVLELEKQQTEAIKKDNEASHQKMQDALLAKSARQRQQKLENTLEPIVRESTSIQEKLNKLNAEKAEIEKEAKLHPGTSRDQNDRKLMLQGVAEDIENTKKELDQKLKEIADLKKQIGATALAPQIQSESDKAATRSKRQGASKLVVSSDASVEEAPKQASGGVVPATIGGTTVTVGEKGKPEAIMPLDVLKNMMGNGGVNEDQRYAQILKLNTNFSGSIDISSKTVEVGKIGNELSKDNNKLLETQTKTSDKLIISMNKVTDMLPNTLSQILSAISSSSGGAAGGAPAGAPSGAGGGVPIPQPSTSGGMIKAGTDMLKKIGLIFSPGRDLQKDNGDIDPKLIDIAKKVQETIPGFSQFTGFNDVYHTENTPKSQHTKGKAFDFSLNKTPSKEEGDKIKSQLKALGLDLVKDEYNDTSGAFRTGGHFHGQLNAYDGGVFEPRPGGVHVNLAEAGLREAAVPLNPGEKIRVEKPESDNNPPRKDPLSTVLANDNQSSSNSNQSAEILASLHELMEDKFDSMISALRDGNNISDKILKYSQA